MGVKVRISFIVLICVLVLAGCGNQSQELTKENGNKGTDQRGL